MFSKKKNYNGLISGIVVTGAVGGLISYLFASETGKETRNSFKLKINSALNKAKETRNTLIADAKTRADMVTSKAAGLLNFTREYAAGTINYPIEKVENEIAKIKAAIAAALTSYQGTAVEKPTDELVDDIFTEFEERTLTEYDDETWVKNEGMGHRFYRR